MIKRFQSLCKTQANKDERKTRSAHNYKQFKNESVVGDALLRYLTPLWMRRNKQVSLYYVDLSLKKLSEDNEVKEQLNEHFDSLAGSLQADISDSDFKRERNIVLAYRYALAKRFSSKAIKYVLPILVDKREAMDKYLDDSQVAQYWSRDRIILLKIFDKDAKVTLIDLATYMVSVSCYFALENTLIESHAILNMIDKRYPTAENTRCKFELLLGLPDNLRTDDNLDMIRDFFKSFVTNDLFLKDLIRVEFFDFYVIPNDVMDLVTIEQIPVFILPLKTIGSKSGSLSIRAKSEGYRHINNKSSINNSYMLSHPDTKMMSAGKEIKRLEILIVDMKEEIKEEMSGIKQEMKGVKEEMKNMSNNLVDAITEMKGEMIRGFTMLSQSINNLANSIDTMNNQAVRTNQVNSENPSRDTPPKPLGEMEEKDETQKDIQKKIIKEDPQ